MKTDQAFHDEKPFLQQISLIYSLPLTDVRKLLHSPLLKGSREVQVLSQQRIPNTHLPVSSYTPGSFPCQTRDRSGTGEINKHSKGESYFRFLLVGGLLQHFLLHYAVRLGEPEKSSHLLLFILMYENLLLPFCEFFFFFLLNSERDLEK